jgi:hypothetical protein
MQNYRSFPVLSDGVNGDVACDVGGAIKRLFLALPDDGSDCFYRRISKDEKNSRKQLLEKTPSEMCSEMALINWVFQIMKP